MARLVQQLTVFLHRLVKSPCDRVLARLRAHMSLAVNDGLREIVRQVMNERVTLSAELTERFAAELAPVRRQLDDLNLCNDGLLREVVRLQREVQQLLESTERLTSKTLAAPSSPRLKLVDENGVRAA